MPRLNPERASRLARLANLSEEQDLVVSRAQLRELGFDAHSVARHAYASQWQVIGSRVVVMHTGGLTWRQRRWIAVLHSGKDSALTGLSAAHAEGLEGFEPHVMETVVPHGARAVDLSHPQLGVRVRQSRVLMSGEIHPTLRPARERLPSAVITAAASASTDQRARLLIFSAVQQRRVRPAELHAALGRRLKIRRRRLLLESISDAEGGVHSLPEFEWLVLSQRYDLPPVTRQRRVRRANGTWYLDCDFDDYLVSVEINRVQHQGLLLAESDHSRRNVLSIEGRLVITLTSYAVRRQGEACVAVVAAALLSRGWRPPPRLLARLQVLADGAGVQLQTGDQLLWRA